MSTINNTISVPFVQSILLTNLLKSDAVLRSLFKVGKTMSNRYEAWKKLLKESLPRKTFYRLQASENGMPFRKNCILQLI